MIGTSRSMRCRTDLKELLEESDRPAPANGRRLKPLYWVAAAALVVVGVGTWAFLRFYPREAALPPPRIVPVTTSGAESPSLSPDGNWVAYHWRGEKGDNSDIYIREVDGTGFSRLTSDPADDCCPAWSPDGRQIAFLRGSGDRGVLYLISPLGGGERKLAEVGQLARLEPSTRLSWSPDGKNIAFTDRKSPKDPTSIWSLSLETLEKKQMTTPDAGIFGDGHPAFSPDGRYLAFVRFRFSGFALYVMGLPRGEPRLVTDYKSPWCICWTADSRDILFTTLSETGEEAIMRISVDGGEPRRVPTRGDAVSQPTVSRNRLAYISNNVNPDIWRLELTGQETINAAIEALNILVVK